MLAKDNHLDELKRPIINLLKEIEEFKGDTKKQLRGSKEKELRETKCGVT